MRATPRGRGRVGRGRGHGTCGDPDDIRPTVLLLVRLCSRSYTGGYSKRLEPADNSCCVVKKGDSDTVLTHVTAECTITSEKQNSPAVASFCPNFLFWWGRTRRSNMIMVIPFSSGRFTILYDCIPRRRSRLPSSHETLAPPSP
jgi:hypothetical protein